MRSNAGMLRSKRATAISGEDWYVEKTTRSPLPIRNAAIADTSLVTGNDKSDTEMIESSSSRRPAVWSEHTQRTSKGSLEAEVQSFKICDKSPSDGTRTRVLLASSRSLTHIETSVLPVPQAMISCPRSTNWKPAQTSSIALSW